MVLGSEGVYLYHLSLAEPDSLLQISFPSAAVQIASVQEFTIAVDMFCLVLDVVQASAREKEESSPSEVAVKKLEELLIYFVSPYFFISE